MNRIQFQQRLLGLQDHMMNFAIKLTANRDDALFINNYHKIVREQTVVDQNTDLYNLNITNDSISGSPDKVYQIQEITKAVAELNDEVKIPFSLFLNGYKYHEIAEQLNLPLGTVKSRIFFARKELQQKLKDYQYA